MVVRPVFSGFFLHSLLSFVSCQTAVQKCYWSHTIVMSTKKPKRSFQLAEFVSPLIPGKTGIMFSLGTPKC